MRKGAKNLPPEQSVASALANCEILSLSLAIKLGSIAVHADEMLSPKGHHFDKVALEGLVQDVEVIAWVKKMGALLPVKR
jgi:hypothetical protein